MTDRKAWNQKVNIFKTYLKGRHSYIIISTIIWNKEMDYCSRENERKLWFIWQIRKIMQRKIS